MLNLLTHLLPMQNLHIGKHQDNADVEGFVYLRTHTHTQLLLLYDLFLSFWHGEFFIYFIIYCTFVLLPVLEKFIPVNSVSNVS